MTTAEVAATLVALCRKHDFEGAMHQLYSQDIVSVEPFDPPTPTPGMTRIMKGLPAVAAKGKWWTENHTIHSFTIGDPFISTDKFAVEMSLDVTNKPSGKRMSMKEIAVYTVANGKIVHEEFLYKM